MVRDTTNRQTIRFTPTETEQLAELARVDDATANEVLRRLVREAYERRFPKMNPGAQIPATPRALLEDLSDGVHYTMRNVASRMRAPIGAVAGMLDTLGRKKIVERVTDHYLAERDYLDQTWELLHPLPKALELTEKTAGVPLDTPFTKHALTFDLLADSATGAYRISPADEYTESYLKPNSDERRRCREGIAHVQPSDRGDTTKQFAEALVRSLEVRFPGATVLVYHAHQTGVAFSDGVVRFHVA